MVQGAGHVGDKGTDLTLLEGKSRGDKMDGTAWEGVEHSEGGVHADGRWVTGKEGTVF